MNMKFAYCNLNYDKTVQVQWICSDSEKNYDKTTNAISYCKLCISIDYTSIMIIG